MRGIPARQGLKRSLFLAFALTAGLSLAACSDIDSMFGGESNEMVDAAPTAGDAGAPPTAAAPMAAAPAAPGGAPVATITPVNIDAGPDTGTAVNKTIQSLRSQVAGLQQKLSANYARLTDLRNQGAGAAGAYQEAKAHITTRLQVGTTRGNPELVAEWNTAQGQLDSLSANVNALNALGTDVTNDSSAAHYALEQIGATFNVSGAVDEDHRQLQLRLIVDSDSSSEGVVDVGILSGVNTGALLDRVKLVHVKRGERCCFVSSEKKRDADRRCMGPVPGADVVGRVGVEPARRREHAIRGP